MTDIEECCITDEWDLDWPFMGAFTIPERKVSQASIKSDSDAASTGIPESASTDTQDASDFEEPRSAPVEVKHVPVRRGKFALMVEIDTTNEEAQDRKVLLNSMVLQQRAPTEGRALRYPSLLTNFRAEWVRKARELEFPAQFDKDAVLDTAENIPARGRPEWNEFKDQMFSRQGAYYIK